jgi:hypothetical protein
MNKALIAVLGVFGVFALIGVGLVVGYVSFSNDANAFEVDIPAQYQQMKNVYDNGWKQVMETAQVPQNYTEDMQKVWQGALTGRYGANGSQATLQFIKEANPQIDASLYKKVQEQIESFHATFTAAQTKIISEKQAYGLMLKATTSGRFYNTIGSYPHIQCGVPDGAADKYAILTSDKTETDFQLHKADALDLRPKK